MVYADTDFFIALLKGDDWLGENARTVLEEHKEDLRTSLPTFIEIMFLSEDYDWDLYRAFSYITEIAEVDVEDKVLLQAADYKEEKQLNTVDAFQAALAEGKIVSSDKEFDKVNLERVKLEEK